MKKAIFILLLPLVFVGYSYTGSIGDVFSDDSTRALTPEEIHFEESVVIAGILSRYHYGGLDLNDSLSSAIFDRYLRVLDYSKLYLLNPMCSNMKSTGMKLMITSVPAR